MAVGLYASFTTMNLLIYMNFMQPYLLEEVFDIARSQQGSITGRLGALQEVVVIVFMSLIGAMSDQTGRRLAYAIGFVFIGAGYFLYPLAGDMVQLAIFRMTFAVGASTIPVMMSAISIEYSQPVTRGKWIGVSNLTSSLGIIFMTLVMAKVPGWLENAGYESADAGRYTFWFAALGAFVAAAVLSQGLKGKDADISAARPNPFLSVAGELRRAKQNPKLALAFGAAFVGRGDLVIIGTFLPLWAMQMGLEDGMTTGQAMGQAGILLFVNQAAVSGWAYFAGMMNDRFDKISVLALSFTFAAVGYFGLWLVADPFNSFIIIAIVILAMGEVSITVTSNSVIGECAPQNSRGATLGVFGVMGAVGITVAMFIGGEIFDMIGKTAPFMMMVGFNAVIIAWALFVRLSENKQRAAATATTPSGGD